MASRTNGTEDSRPTLPPIRSLNLPFLPSRPNHDNLPYSQPNSQHYQFNYRLSATLSSSSSSGTLRFTTWPSSTLVSSSPSGDALLEACTLDIADAIVVVLSRPAAEGQSESANVDQSASESKFFLVGPALDQFRQEARSTPIPRGARVYPYRVIRVFPNNQGRSTQHAVDDNSQIRAGSSSASSDVADSSRSPSPRS